MPLALELAAARVRVFSVAQIAARLDDRFRLLTAGPRTALPHQQTLRATVDWSYALLAEPERTLLRRLSVFAGGWTFEAAEAVAAGDGIQPHAVLDLLAQLVDKSLVIAEEQRDAVRYRLLETIRRVRRRTAAGGGGGGAHPGPAPGLLPRPGGGGRAAAPRGRRARARSPAWRRSTTIYARPWSGAWPGTASKQRQGERRRGGAAAERGPGLVLVGPQLPRRGLAVAGQSPERGPASGRRRA